MPVDQIAAEAPEARKGLGRRGVKETGREGLPAEWVLRCALLKHGDQVSRLGIIETPIFGVPSPTMQGVLASYWHIGLYAHPRLPELLITGREREYLEEFIRTYQYKRDAFSKEDMDEYAHHLASPGGLRGALGVYRAILAEAPDLVQLTNTTLTMPVWAVGGDHFDGHGALRTVSAPRGVCKGGRHRRLRTLDHRRTAR